VDVGSLEEALLLGGVEPAVDVAFGVALLTAEVLVAKLAALRDARSTELHGGSAFPCADIWNELATLVSVCPLHQFSSEPFSSTQKHKSPLLLVFPDFAEEVPNAPQMHS
jgi:hypothetical protein